MPAVPRSPRCSRAAAAQPLKTVLPAAALGAEVTLRRTLEARRSTRDFSTSPLRLDQLAALLWAAQGITSPGGLRTAPSAGAIYPLRSYFLSFRVQGLAAGFYGYDVEARSLTMLAAGNKQAHLVKACSDQQCVQECAGALLLTAWYGRVRREFGALAEKLVAIEAGHIGQNWHLQASALALGSLSLGNFDATALKMLLPIPQDEEPIYLLLAGRV